jgi:carbamoyl-phosphate synthase / aspartate carbamoyltransferase
MPPDIAGDDRRPVTPSQGNLHVEPPLPSSPTSAASVGLSVRGDGSTSPAQLRPPSGRPSATMVRTVSAQTITEDEKKIYLELKDGIVYEGYSFGAERSAAGELVFQTGMVGYPESITDPSYRGQLLVITFPLVGNYGVPSRTVIDELLGDLPKYFESSEIHIVGLIVASYCGEDFSHYLAESSLGKWLKENDVPAMHGVDTRALTRHIREAGSMLGRMLHQKRDLLNGLTNGDHASLRQASSDRGGWMSETEFIDWIDPNIRNLVRDGKPTTFPTLCLRSSNHEQYQSVNHDSCLRPRTLL